MINQTPDTPTISAHPTWKPFSIQEIAIATPLTLAPMAGHTNYAFRSLVREISDDCGLVCTEVISSNVLNNRGSMLQAVKRFDWVAEEEAPLAVQIFGAEPYKVAEAAKIVVDHGATLIDINMGCWVPKVAKKGGGAALLRDINVATAVVEAVVAAVDVPVTVKVRAGFEDGKPTAIAFAKAAEEAGVQAIAVHARYAGQGHTGTADWDIIRRVKQNTRSIPVIGNGDVVDADSAMRMMTETGCDAVMVGRAALRQPWIFQHIAHVMQHPDASPLPYPTRPQRARYALHLAERTLQHTWMRQESAIKELRGQISKLQLDLPGSVQVRNRIVRINTWDDIESILQPIIESEA